jgi:hypothetical protein
MGSPSRLCIGEGSNGVGNEGETGVVVPGVCSGGMSGRNGS